MLTAKTVYNELQKLGSEEKAKASAWFFKTGKGQYGEGDVFFGVTVPEQRNVAKKFASLPLTEIDKLLKNKVHECRQTALMILGLQYRRADTREKEEIVKFYLSRKKYVNNWDMVDGSAPNILGHFLLNKKREILYTLVRSRNLWERRIAIIATYAFIRENEFDDTLKISELLLSDTHDLIHKAVGWMLREVGNRSIETEEKFLKKHALVMPRTMLRYAIEKFPEGKRRKYLTMRR